MTENSLKLVIQIPCYNEEETLHIALEALPKEIPGISEIDVIVIDDGSHDNTVEVAKKHGVDQVVSLGGNRGLARGYMAGIEAALMRGADIIVNTDADNQYDAECIKDLVVPIINKKADIVVGKRPILEIEHFSKMKKRLQVLGSNVMRFLSQTDVADAPSGFRAVSREAAIRLMVLTDYTYTMETLIHAGHSRLKVENVPVNVNGDLRPSRLVKSIRSYVTKSAGTMLRVWSLYNAPRVFWGVGLLSMAYSFISSAVNFFAAAPWPGTSGPLLWFLTGILLFALGMVSDQMKLNRRLLEDIRVRQIKERLDKYKDIK